jgi:hypothetical protein
LEYSIFELESSNLFIYLFIYLTDMCWSHHSTTGIASREAY